MEPGGPVSVEPAARLLAFFGTATVTLIEMVTSRYGSPAGPEMLEKVVSSSRIVFAFSMR